MCLRMKHREPVSVINMKEVAPSAEDVDAAVGEAAIENCPAHTEQFRSFGSIASRLVECSQKLGTFVVAGTAYKR